MRTARLALGIASTAVVLGGVQALAARSTPAPSYRMHETWNAFSGTRGDPQPTDLYAFQSILRLASGARAGVVDGYAVNLRPPMVAWHATARLGGGTLTVEGVVDQSSDMRVLPIVGGSDSYAGASGQIVLTPDPNGRDDDVSIDLTS